MSTCISQHGEFSSHETGEDFTCRLCFAFDEAGALAEVERLRDAQIAYRELTRRLGFGDNITEPQADNNVIVAWFDQQSRDANEWVESQLWRNDCYAKGHPDDDDCFECDPHLRLQCAEAAASRVKAVCDEAEKSADTYKRACIVTTGKIRDALAETSVIPPAEETPDA